MRLNTKILVPWLLFSITLLGGFFLLEFQLSSLRGELNERISVHQRAVQVSRDLRYLSLERLALALQREPATMDAVMAELQVSEDRTTGLITELEGLLRDEVHDPGLEGRGQGHGLLAAYALAREPLPELYRRWYAARARPDLDDEPLRRRQLLLRFDLVDAMLEDLTQYHEITQQLVVDQTNARIERNQAWFHGFIALVLIAVIAFARYQGHTLATPLRQLSRAAQTVAQGGSARFEVRSSVDEIQTLNGALATMVGQLQAYVEQLSARQEEILGQMARMAKIGGWELDLDSDKLTWTEEVYHIHELNPTDAPPLDHAIAFYAPEARATIQDAIAKAVAEGTPWDLELPFITAQGRHLWVRALGKPVWRNGRIARLNGAFQDITAQKQTLDAIRQANADLEGFSYSVSHDLRAPLRAIDGYIEMLLEDHIGQLDDEGRRMFGVVQTNARKMGRLIDDILAFSRAGRLEMDWQPVDTKALIQEVWSTLEEQRSGHEVLLEAEEDLPIVWGDPRALRQIWSNLLGNAIKFSRERRPGRVRVSAERQDDWARFTIQDNGVGFDPAYVNKLFVLFQRLHGMDEFEGTGVGLAIVKRFVQKHGGLVTATAVPDGGACFSFSIPLHAGAQGAVLGAPEAPVTLPPAPSA